MIVRGGINLCGDCTFFSYYQYPENVLKLKPKVHLWLDVGQFIYTDIYNFNHI